jgi:hypothetical protein
MGRWHRRRTPQPRPVARRGRLTNRHSGDQRPGSTARAVTFASTASRRPAQHG